MEIPHDMHTSIIGPKGSSIQSIIDECGGVSVHFPPGHSSSNVVTLHGSKESVEMAQKRLADVVHEKVSQPSSSPVNIQLTAISRDAR